MKCLFRKILAAESVALRVVGIVLAASSLAYGHLGLGQVAVLPNWFNRTWPCGDANHNGRFEIYGTIGYTGAMVIYENTGGNSYREVTTCPNVLGEYDFGDPDSDGLAELLVHRENYMILKSLTPDTFPTESIWAFNLPTGALIGKFADLDRDGRGEVVFLSNSSDGVVAYEVCAGGQYVSIPFPSSNACGRDFGVGDFDQDGMKEVAAGTSGDSLYVFECAGDDRYVLAAKINVWPDFESYDVTGADDMDGDGLPEFVVVSRHDGNSCCVRIFEEPAHNEFSCVWQSKYRADIGLDAPRAVAEGDVDGDGRDEFAVSTGRDVRLFKSTGPNQYEQVWQLDCSDVRWIRFFDLNGNGRAEMIIDNSVGSMSIFEDTEGLAVAEYARESWVRAKTSLQPTIARRGTAVQFEGLPAQAEVEIANISGRLIRRLWTRRNEAWQWDMRDDQGVPVPVGTYYCVVRARDRSTSLKLCVVK